MHRHDHARRPRRAESRRRLEKRREEIARRLQALRLELLRREPGVEAEDDVGRSGSELDVDLAVAAGHARTLRRIDEALRDLDERRYGVCVDCGRAIDPARLRVLPFAARCRDCQAAREASAVRGRSVAPGASVGP
jgi:DnaK suppressor protein